MGKKTRKLKSHMFNFAVRNKPGGKILKKLPDKVKEKIIDAALKK